MSSIEKKIQESAARRGLILNRDDIACVMDICTRNEVLRVEERISLTKESVDAKTNAKTQTKGTNATGEDTYAGALRAPRAGSPAVVFVFVLINLRLI